MSAPVHQILLKAWPLFFSGLVTTILLATVALLIGGILGTIMGTVICRRLRVAAIAPLLEGYVFFFRGTPYFLQMLIMYFVVPDLLGIDLSPFAAGAISLGLCSTAYVAEIVRSGINAIAPGQWDACKVLGYSTYEAVRFVILPQMFAHMTPALVSECVSVVLSTSVISQIGALELTKASSNIIAREMHPMAIYTASAALYLLFTTAILCCGKLIERRMQRAYR